MNFATNSLAERIRPTRSGLFAIELLIAVGVFIFCATVCVGIFIRAEVVSLHNNELALAVNSAKSVAECFKAAGGDLADTAALCGGSVAHGALTLTLADDLTLYLTPKAESGYTLGTITVSSSSSTLLSWEIAAAALSEPSS